MSSIKNKIKEQKTEAEHWGHVGDLAHIVETLREIDDYFRAEVI